MLRTVVRPYLLNRREGPSVGTAIQIINNQNPHGGTWSCTSLARL